MKTINLNKDSLCLDSMFEPGTFPRTSQEPYDLNFFNLCVISDFPHDVKAIFALLVRYAAQTGSNTPEEQRSLPRSALRLIILMKRFIKNSRNRMEENRNTRPGIRVVWCCSKAFEKLRQNLAPCISKHNSNHPLQDAQYFSFNICH